jgi:hypothetical protein
VGVTRTVKVRRFVKTRPRRAGGAHAGLGVAQRVAGLNFGLTLRQHRVAASSKITEVTPLYPQK